jgi:CubicO group peptidase (beta-lactamase class C family)
MSLFRPPLVACAVFLAAVGSFTLPTTAAAPAPPVQGVPVPELAAFDTVMLLFMVKNDISAGQLAVMRNGVVVLERSYGWQDKQRMKSLPLGALMRIASVNKPFTAAAIRELIRQGKLTLKTRVFSLRAGDGGILAFLPHGAPDRHLKDITIEDCLRHRGGWDRDEAGDLTYREREAAVEMDVPMPPSAVDMVRYIMGQPLQFSPGTKKAYSNIGYMLLGLVIEKVLNPNTKFIGEDYLIFLRQNVTRPAGIPDSELILGRSLLVDADECEPYYDHPRKYQSVFEKHLKVRGPYGESHMEARTGQGRIITNARSLVLFLDKYMVNSDASYVDIGALRWPPGDWEFAHEGKKKGTEAIARQRGDGINYAVIFNKDCVGCNPDYAAQIRKQLDELIDSGIITSWPQKEPPRVGVCK